MKNLDIRTFIQIFELQTPIRNLAIKNLDIMTPIREPDTQKPRDMNPGIATPNSYPDIMKYLDNKRSLTH